MIYYKTNSRKVSFGEYWNLTKGRTFFLACAFKILGLPLTLSAGLPSQQPYRESIIDHSAVPPEVMQKFSPLIADLQRLGFNQFWFTTLKNSLAEGAAYAVQGLEPSGETTGRIIYARVRTIESLVVAFSSQFENGMILATTNKKKDLLSPPGYKIQRKLGAGAEELWQMHRKGLGEMSSSRKLQLIQNFDQLAAFEDQVSTRNYRDKIGRGVWVPMTPEEVEALKRKRASDAPVGHV